MNNDRARHVCGESGPIADPVAAQPQSSASHANSRPLAIIGAACGLGMPESHCAEAPAFLRKHLRASAGLRGLYQWRRTLSAPPAQTGVFPPRGLASFSRRLAKAVSECVLQGRRFIVFGGDHSSAIGTWNGACRGLRGKGPLGVVWIDAHMDAHTGKTSPSGRAHGMPVATLLGEGDPALDFFGEPLPACVRPEHLCLVGVRSYEPEEAALLQRLGVRIYFMEEVRQRGLVAVMREAVAHVTAHTAGFGIALDLDSIDPEDAPAVTTPVREGITPASLLPAWRDACADPRLIGMEIVEFNPPADRDGRTARLVEELVKTAASAP